MKLCELDIVLHYCKFQTEATSMGLLIVWSNGGSKYGLTRCDLKRSRRVWIKSGQGYEEVVSIW